MDMLVGIFMDWIHVGYGVWQWNLEGGMLLEFSLWKELCMSNTWFKREEKRKVIFRLGEKWIEIDFVLIKNNTDSLYEM